MEFHRLTLIRLNPGRFSMARLKSRPISGFASFLPGGGSPDSGCDSARRKASYPLVKANLVVRAVERDAMQHEPSHMLENHPAGRIRGWRCEGRKPEKVASAGISIHLVRCLHAGGAIAASIGSGPPGSRIRTRQAGQATPNSNY